MSSLVMLSVVVATDSKSFRVIGLGYESLNPKCCEGRRFNYKLILHLFFFGLLIIEESHV